MTARDYTHPSVLTSGVTEGWAEAVTDPARIDWPARQAAAAIPFEVIDGRPVNPCEVTAVRHGRNELGRWGENLMADALVTATWQGRRFLLMVERGDGYGWAVPGGSAETGESGAEAAARELAEETSLAVSRSLCQAGEPLYVPDPRASDEAWAVTIPVAIDLGDVRDLPEVSGADDARRAAWIPAASDLELVTALDIVHSGHVFAAHAGMLAVFLGSGQAEPQPCGRCKSAPGVMKGLDPARGLFCRACTDRCHEATDFAHICQVCAGPEERYP